MSLARIRREQALVDYKKSLEGVAWKLLVPALPASWVIGGQTSVTIAFYSVLLSWCVIRLIWLYELLKMPKRGK